MLPHEPDGCDHGLARERGPDGALPRKDREDHEEHGDEGEQRDDARGHPEIRAQRHHRRRHHQVIRRGRRADVPDVRKPAPVPRESGDGRDRDHRETGGDREAHEREPLLVARERERRDEREHRVEDLVLALAYRVGGIDRIEDGDAGDERPDRDHRLERNRRHVEAAPEPGGGDDGDQEAHEPQRDRVGKRKDEGQHHRRDHHGECAHGGSHQGGPSQPPPRARTSCTLARFCNVSRSSASRCVCSADACEITTSR